MTEQHRIPDDNEEIKPETFEDVVRSLVDSAREGIKVEFGAGQNPIYPEVLATADLDAPSATYRVDLFKERRGLFGLGRSESYKWPFPDSSVSFVYGGHFLEHVPDWNKFWREMGRVVMPGGRCVFLFPYAYSNRYHQDPTHCQPLVEERFVYLNRPWREANGLDHYLADVNFVHEFKPWYDYAREFKHLGAEQLEFKRKHMLNVVDNMAVFLINGEGVYGIPPKGETDA